jgi:hypothetical protein
MQARKLSRGSRQHEHGTAEWSFVSRQRKQSLTSQKVNRAPT